MKYKNMTNYDECGISSCNRQQLMTPEKFFERLCKLTDC